MPHLSRREFLGGTVITLAALAARRGRAAETPPDLVDVHGTDHAVMVKAVLAPLGGIAAFVKKGARVVLKPNWSFAVPPEWGASTHPATVMTVAALCLEAGAADVTIIENLLAPTDKALRRTGARAALDAAPAVRLKILGDDADFREVAVPGGTVLKKVRIAKLVLDADLYINLPNAKSHGGATVSFGLKNAMGVIADRRALHDGGLSEAIVDLGRVLRPRLTILDATRVLITNGPSGPGETETPGRMVAGTNVVSVDAYGLGLAHYQKRDLKVSDVRHIELAGKAGLGETDVAKLRIQKVNV